MKEELISVDPINILKSRFIGKNFDVCDVSTEDVNILRKVANNIEKKIIEYKEPLLKLYPDKFKIIINPNQITEDGIYYINSKIPLDVEKPLYTWICDVLNKERICPAGHARGSISYSDFCTKYDYGMVKLSKVLCMSNSEMNFYHKEYNINSIVFMNNRIILWGEIFKGIIAKDLKMTITIATILMNIFDIFYKKGLDYMYEYLENLAYNGIIYNFDTYENETFITFAKCAIPFRYNFEEVGAREYVLKHLNYLKQHLLIEE